MKLITSSVVFNQEDHTYTNTDGKLLSGITSLLVRQLFQDKYFGISQDVLDKAKERGTYIHECCELLDTVGIVSPEVEVESYIALVREAKLPHEASEYLVSDNDNYASCIDKVYRLSDTEFALGDIKTTYKLDEPYLQWQLSIYAYLFEQQNSGAKVTKLYAIWLRGDKKELREVQRIEDSVIEQLLAADIKGEQFNSPSISNENLPTPITEQEDYIVELYKKLAELESMKKSITESIAKAMQEAGATKWTGAKVTFTKKADTTRKSFDKEKFDQDYPNVYDQYIKESKVQGGLLVTFKK